MTIVLFALLVVGGLLFLAPSENHWRFDESEYPAYVPAPGDSFAYYIAENQRRIRLALEDIYGENAEPFGEGYDLEKVLLMRSPYELSRSDSCDASEVIERQGFLLIHGLSDSPYLLSAVAKSLSRQYPCSLVRGLLSPGHGTVPGDLLSVERETWKHTVDWGVTSFAGEVGELVLVGYSNGAALTMHHANDNRVEIQSGESLVKGSVLLSPGLKPLDTRAFLSPWVKPLVKWVNQDSDSDAVKYESFTMNAAAEFYRLGQVLEAEDFDALKLPIMMVVSSEDSTVDNQSAVTFFCEKVEHADKHLLWYSTPESSTQPEQECSGLEVRKLDPELSRFISFTHVGLTIPASDSHYGIEGHQQVCLAYGQQPEQYESCLNDNENTVYAENNFRDHQGLYDGRLVRRSSFNPDYENMLESIFAFVDAL